MTAVFAAAAAVFLVLIPVAYYFGRRSASESYVDRVLDAETDRRRLNPQKAADRAESGGES